ncbi:MAG: hydantoinase/oxoprolinase family protein [Acidobacteriota bacterium]|nr:hydantoinase/oxoprolinase family protein [Acidobacteriota bacterium]
MRIGIDSGGTFTDFAVLHRSGRLETFKLRSDPANPAAVILRGIERAAQGTPAAAVVHGSTVATNALLERKGARTAFVTTAGFEDLLTIGRQYRPELYNLTPPPRRELVPEALRFGVTERMLFDGAALLAPSGLEELAERVSLSGAESVAVCLLHSYENPAHERAVLAALSGAGYICASHEISPEFREFERASTTVINAYVGPLMDRYLGELERLCPFPVAIMQSNGGFLTASEARLQAARTILSGPAGGIVGATAMAAASGFERALTFDMGGTSTDVSLAERHPRLTTEAYIDGYPVRLPMLDIHTVGSGGGSLARVDEGGRLLVGPESAGSNPGPACYGTGTLATVTDAHVVLGRIAANQFLGGAMRIYPERAEVAVSQIAAAMQCSVVDAALGILRIANANMERAIRVVSVERGEDPRDFPLVAFGGCGGLHACEMAEELGISTVLIPQHAGVLSALGMLLADRTRDYSAAALKAPRPELRFEPLEQQAQRDLPGAILHRSVDIRYAGQSYELTVPWSPAQPDEPFHREHHRVYGYSDPTRPTEIVAVRLRAVLPEIKPALQPQAAAAHAAPAIRRVQVGRKWQKIPALERSGLQHAIPGPALILDYGSTTLLPNRWTATPDSAGNLILTA